LFNVENSPLPNDSIRRAILAPHRDYTNGKAAAFLWNSIGQVAWSRDGKRLAFERGAEINDVTLISDFK
jgi:hypothetical protein